MNIQRQKRRAEINALLHRAAIKLQELENSTLPTPTENEFENKMEIYELFKDCLETEGGY